MSLFVFGAIMSLVSCPFALILGPSGWGLFFFAAQMLGLGIQIGTSSLFK
jgi:hypothetical protein